MDPDLHTLEERRTWKSGAIQFLSWLSLTSYASQPLPIFGELVPAFCAIEQTKLDWSTILDDLKVPPGNGLEAPKADRKGQHSIRINQQWRVCFVWTAEGAADVEIVDYH